jgi:hypothetical protein
MTHTVNLSAHNRQRLAPLRPSSSSSRGIRRKDTRSSSLIRNSNRIHSSRLILNKDSPIPNRDSRILNRDNSSHILTRNRGRHRQVTRKDFRSHRTSIPVRNIQVQRLFISSPVHLRGIRLAMAKRPKAIRREHILKHRSSPRLHITKVHRRRSLRLHRRRGRKK